MPGLLGPMHVQPLSAADWNLFLRLAQGENWIVPLKEQLLFQHQWRPYFLALRHGGKTCGFVSAVCYRHSGWIGNLLVDPNLRGQGYGRLLFEEALKQLQQRRLKRIWLTASEQGQPLYDSYGFRPIDSVIRFSVPGSGGQPPAQTQAGLNCLVALDQDCWGEDRSDLIGALAIDSMLLRQADNLALLQPGLDFWQLGPWSAAGADSRHARKILNTALAATPAGKHLFIDTPGSSGLELMLRQSGFSRHGHNSLMYRGEKPRLRKVIALASFGSIG